MKNKTIRKTIIIEYDQDIGTMTYNNIILNCIDSNGKVYHTNLNDKSIKNTITQLTKNYTTWIKYINTCTRPKCLNTYTKIEIKMLNGKTKICLAGDANFHWPRGINQEGYGIHLPEEFVKAWRFAK